MTDAETGTGKKQRQQGMAIVAVLGVLTVVMVMVIHLTTITELAARETLVVSERSRLRYVAESMADRALWLHMVDRRLFPDRTLGKVNTAREDSDWEDWMLDGREHEFQDVLCRVSLADADVGIDFTGKGPEETLRNQGDPEDLELKEKVDVFIDVWGDYVDTDDLTKLHGKEADDYAAEGQYTLPRNDAMQFREEVYWLDNWSDVVFGDVRIIPPDGVDFPSSKGKTKPPFFSSSSGMIREVGRFTDLELTEVLEARNRWQTERTPLDESLDADILGRVKSSFSFTESPVVTIVGRATSKDGLISREIRVTRYCDSGRQEAYNDTQRQVWALWERLLF